MQALQLGEAADFPFLDPPQRRHLRAAQQALFELGAVDTAGALTGIGRQLARFPLDPSLGRMLIEAGTTGALREVLIITAALTVPDPRERPLAAREHADQIHRQFADARSDFLTLAQHLSRLRAGGPPPLAGQAAPVVPRAFFVLPAPSRVAGHRRATHGAGQQHGPARRPASMPTTTPSTAPCWPACSDASPGARTVRAANPGVRACPAAWRARAARSCGCSPARRWPENRHAG